MVVWLRRGLGRSQLVRHGAVGCLVLDGAHGCEPEAQALRMELLFTASTLWFLVSAKMAFLRAESILHCIRHASLSARLALASSLPSISLSSTSFTTNLSAMEL